MQLTKICLCLFLIAISKIASASPTKSYQYPCKTRSEMCQDIYKPVCGYENIVCVKAPCNQYTTFPNACSACQNTYIEGYKLDECPKEEGRDPVA